MKILIFILPFFILTSCKVSEPSNDDLSVKEPPQVMPIIELAVGTNGGFQTSIKKVITTQEEFTSTWEMAYSNFMNAQKPPRIDFEENQVVLVAMGMKNSGGYSIKVTSINNAKGNLLINTEETSPGNNCMTTEAITFPFQLVQIKKTGGKVIFNSSEKIIDCESK